MDEKIIGVDLGATKTTVGVIQNQKVIKERTFPTSAQASKQQIISELIDGIEKVAEDSVVSGIGIGVPGLVDEDRGIIYDLWNIPSWKEVHLKDQLEEHFGVPVRITNDANVFAIGEKIFGKGAAYKSMVGITLGTGFGVGIIANHKIHSGLFSSAGEIGMLPYLDKTIEDYCSGKFFQDGHDSKGDDLFRAAQQGDERALKIFSEFGRHLGEAIKLILHVLSPEAIFLGGSISKSYKFFRESLSESVNEFPFQKVKDNLIIEPSQIINVSLLGSAALIVSERSNEKTVSHPVKKPV